MTNQTTPDTDSLDTSELDIEHSFTTSTTGATMKIAEKPTATHATQPPAPGEYWPQQGGHYICTLPAVLDMPARHLIAGVGEAEEITFGPYEDVPDAKSAVNGAANTAALMAASGKHPAAQWAASYTADGHTDFFLPARLDLYMAQIAAPQLFKKSGWYWSSSQGSRNGAFAQDFSYGLSGWYLKDYEFRARAFRVIPL